MRLRVARDVSNQNMNPVARVCCCCCCLPVVERLLRERGEYSLDHFDDLGGRTVQLLVLPTLYHLPEVRENELGLLCQLLQNIFLAFLCRCLGVFRCLGASQLIWFVKAARCCGGSYDRVLIF